MLLIAHHLNVKTEPSLSVPVKLSSLSPWRLNPNVSPIDYTGDTRETTIFHEENIAFKASGFEGSLSVNLYSEKVDYITEYAIDEGGDLNLTFPNKHFQNFCRFTKVSKEVKLSFSDALPMQMLFMLDHIEEDIDSWEVSLNERSYLRFCLAPKISDDE